MRWSRHKRGDNASYQQKPGELVDEIGAPLEAAFACADAIRAPNSAVARARRMLEPYARVRP